MFFTFPGYCLRTQAKSKTIKFCGSKLKVWQPSSAVSDVTMAQLSGEATFQGMLKELYGLSDCKAGKLMTKAEADAYCTEHGVQVLATRWVTNEKIDNDGADIVRSRRVWLLKTFGAQRVPVLWKFQVRRLR